MTARLAGLLAVAVTASCARAPAPPYRLPAGANVIIVVLDACRPDKLEPYGFARPTSPHLAAFARDPDAVLYRRHHASAAATRSSTASLFTGLPVNRHGVLTVMRRPDRPPADGQTVTAYSLDERWQTLAEALQARGFATFGVVHTHHVGRAYGFAQGFDDYDDPGSDPLRIERFVDRAAHAARPFFGYLHLLACHHPFPAEERDAAYMARYAQPYDEAGRRAAGVDFTSAALLWPIRDGALRLNEADVRFLHLVYEAGVRRMDSDSVAVLVAALRGAGLYDESLIVVTADHGEELYDHQGYAHGHALWQPVIHVPLLVKFPAGARPPGIGPEVTALTSAVDLFPTILAAAGAPVPEGLDGLSIFAPVPERAILAETIGVDGVTPLWAVLAGPHKLLASGSRRQLFDLRQDPGERDDRAGAAPSVVAELAAHAARLGAGGAAPAPTVRLQLPAEVLEQLRSLGYASPDG